VKDSSIWYFHAEKPSLPAVISSEKVCRFYSLAPYLERGFTVDDITTAIQTGWKMSGDITVPELKYHKETKLLIAFGEPDKLATIESVLKTLPTSNATRTELDNMQTALDRLQKEVKTVTLPPRYGPLQPVIPPPANMQTALDHMRQEVKTAVSTGSAPPLPATPPEEKPGK
jgi:hypothetical protein